MDLVERIKDSEELKRNIIDYQEKIERLKKQCWDLLKDKETTEYMKYFLESSSVSEGYKKECANIDNTLGKIINNCYERYNYINQNCKHEMVILGENYAICPFCSHYIRLEDAPSSLIIFGNSEGYNDFQLKKIRAMVWQTFERNPKADLSDIRYVISKNMEYLDGQRRTRKKHENKKNSHA